MESNSGSTFKTILNQAAAPGGEWLDIRMGAIDLKGVKASIATGRRATMRVISGRPRLHRATKRFGIYLQSLQPMACNDRTPLGHTYYTFPSRFLGPCVSI